MMKTHKNLILLTLAMLLFLPLTSGLLVEQNQTISCSGNLTYADKILSKGEYNNSHMIVHVQVTDGGFPDPNIILIRRDNCENSTTSATESYDGESVSISHDIVSDEESDYFYVPYTATGTVYLARYNKSFNFIDRNSLVNTPQDFAIDTSNNRIYAYRGNRNIDVYSENMVYLQTITATSDIEDITCTATTDCGIYYYDDYFILKHVTGGDHNYYTMTKDFQTLLENYTGLDMGSKLLTPVGKTSDGVNLIGRFQQSTSFTTYTITDFYNSPYTIINGSYYSTSLCVDSNNLCDNASVKTNIDGDIQIYCEANGTIDYCSDSCENQETTIDNLTIISGVCQDLACDDECNQIDATSCTSLNTYTQCVLGVDGCLDLTTNFYCPINQYCFEGQCDNYSVDKSGLWTQDGLSVSADLTTTNAYNKTQGTAEFLIGASTTPITTTVGVAPSLITQYLLKSVFESVTSKYETVLINKEANDTGYEGISCDFKNNYLEQDYLIHNDLSGNGWSTDASITEDEGLYYLQLNSTTNAEKTLPTTNDNLQVEIMLSFSGTTNTTLNFFDNSKHINNLVIEYNSSTKRIIIREDRFNKVIVNETSLSTPDDLSRVVLQGRYMRDLKSYHYEVIIIRDILDEDVIGRTYSLPVQYNDTTASVPTLLRIDNNRNNVSVYQVISKEQANFPNFREQNESITPLSCTQSTTNCKNVRLFGNNLNTPTYHFYKDLQICVGEVGSKKVTPNDAQETEGGVLEDITNKEYSQRTKLLIAIGVILGVFIMFLGLGLSLQQNYIIITGSIISGLFLIYFSIIGYIPFWSIILLAIIGAGFVAMGAKKLVSE